MQESEYQPLGTVSGTEVGVQASLGGQDILIQHTDTGHRLTRLLQPEAARTVLRGHTVFWRVSHNREVDALLVELIDLFISICYAHPALVQLELALSEGEETVPEPAAP
jgi:hypothetical protein